LHPHLIFSKMKAAALLLALAILGSTVAGR